MRPFRNTILIAKVNFGISIVFVLVYGIFLTSVVLRVAQLDDPITSSPGVGIDQVQ